MTPINNEEAPLSAIPATSLDVRKEMLEKIREMYPSLFSEGGSLNTKELQALVDDYSKPEAERYSFPWAGKTASKRFAFTPSKARLVPDKARSVDFDTTQNLIIEGENLEVLKLLQSSYFKKVKMIYIDPPYNTGHDFVYPDDYSESKQAYWEKGGVTENGVRMDTNTESSGRYHSNWLSMMQSRLLLARNLLRDDGVIFVSIDDNEVHNLRRLMDEIFGEENFVECLIWKRRATPPNDRVIGCNHEYIQVFAKNIESIKLNLKVRTTDDEKDYINPDNDSRGRYRISDLSGSNKGGRATESCVFGIKDSAGKEFFPPLNKRWLYNSDKVSALIEDGRIGFRRGSGTPFLKRYLSEVREGLTLPTVLTEVGTSQDSSSEIRELFDADVFEFPKPLSLLKRILVCGSGNDEVILDFFSGSGGTAHAMMELNRMDGDNRKFILVQLPEQTDEGSEAFKSGYKTISQITIERVKRAGAKIKTEKPDMDAGFKVLRLAQSLFPQNLFEVDPDMTEEQKIKAWEEYLEKSKQAHLFGFDSNELLFEILLKDGFDLNFKSEPVDAFKKNKVMRVTDGEKSALICLDEIIDLETVKTLESYKEHRFICLERAVDSTRKWNLKRVFGDRLWVA